MQLEQDPRLNEKFRWYEANEFSTLGNDILLNYYNFPKALVFLAHFEIVGNNLTSQYGHSSSFLPISKS